MMGENSLSKTTEWGEGDMGAILPTISDAKQVIGLPNPAGIKILQVFQISPYPLDGLHPRPDFGKRCRGSANS